MIIGVGFFFFFFLISKQKNVLKKGGTRVYRKYTAAQKMPKKYSYTTAKVTKKSFIEQKSKGVWFFFLFEISIDLNST